MLAEVRYNGVQQLQGRLDEPDSQEGVWIALLADQVCLFEREDFVERMLGDIFVPELAVTCFGQVDDVVEFVGEDAVPLIVGGGVIGSGVEAGGTNAMVGPGFYPTFEDEEFEDGGVGSLVFEVSVVKAITSITQRYPRGIHAELLNSVSHRGEIAITFRHLLPINIQISVAEVRTRPLLLIRPNCCVLVQTHGQMIPDQVLRRAAHVHGIPEVELFPQL